MWTDLQSAYTTVHFKSAQQHIANGISQATAPNKQICKKLIF